MTEGKARVIIYFCRRIIKTQKEREREIEIKKMLLLLITEKQTYAATLIIFFAISTQIILVYITFFEQILE